MNENDSRIVVQEPDKSGRELGFERHSLRSDLDPALIYINSLPSPGSRRTMTHALETVARLVSQGRLGLQEFPWWNLRYQHMEAIRARLLTGSPATAKKTITAVRQVLLRCRRLNMMTGDEYAAAIDIPRITAKSELKGRLITHEEIIKLIESCESSPIGARDRTIVIMLTLGGMRRSEVSMLLLQDYSARNRLLFVRKGKGNKPREVPVNDDLAKALESWLLVRGNEPGPLICRVLKGDRVAPQLSLSDQSIFDVVVKLAKKAGLEERISPHDFRRTLISNLLDNGTDIKTISKIVGHEQIETTGKYDRRGIEAMKRAVNSIPSIMPSGRDAHSGVEPRKE